MKFTVTDLHAKKGLTALNLGNEKELISLISVIAEKDGKIAEIIDARCYMGKSSNASVVYSSVWVHSCEYYTSGRGKAGGYGYCKQSAAISEALHNAGIRLDHDLSGRGMSAAIEACEAIAIALGYKVLFVKTY